MFRALNSKCGTVVVTGHLHDVHKTGTLREWSCNSELLDTLWLNVISMLMPLEATLILYFLRAFAKFRKATYIRHVSLCLHGTILLPLDGCSLNLVLAVFRKSVEKILVSLDSDKKITGTLHEDLCTFMMISCRILLRMRNVSDRNVLRVLFNI
jgi:hypothetical protein